MEKLIKTEVKETITYLASDGKKFSSEYDCKEYENFSIANRDFQELYKKLGCEDNEFGYRNIDCDAPPIRLIYSKANEDDILKLYKMLLRYLYDGKGKLYEIKLLYQQVDENTVDNNIFTEASCEEGKPILIIQRRYDGDDYTYPSDETYIMTPRNKIDNYIVELDGLFGIDLTKEM